MKGFTLRYRPWRLVYSEAFEEKKEAMKREKFLKCGREREEVRQIINNHI